MSDKFTAGLTDQDEFGQYPSAVSPLTALGIDPDMARANPDLLPSSSKGGKTTPPPSSSDRIPVAPSVKAAGALGGVADTSDTSTPATAPVTPPGDTESYGIEGLGLLNKNLKSATEAAGEVPTQTPADITKLTAQREKLATPAPVFDPSTGKRLETTQEYDPKTGQMVDVKAKEGIGGKIWRGVRGGLVGLATGGLPGALTGALEPQDIAGGKGYNAPTKQYEQAETRRQENLDSTDASLKTAQAAWKEAVDASKAKASEFRANATLGKDLTTGATGLINASTNRTKADNESPENKAKEKTLISQGQFDQRQQELQNNPQLSKLSPLNKMLYMANGKLPDPKQPNEAEVNAEQAARALVVFKQQHGGRGPQTLEEFNAMISAAKGNLSKGKPAATDAQLRAISDKKNSAIEKANQDYAKKRYLPGADLDYQRQLTTIQNGFEEDMSDVGRAGDHMIVSVDPKSGHATWKPEATAPQTPAGKPQPAPDGTRRQSPDGTIEVKRNQQWVKE